MGVFGKLFSGLARTREAVGSQISRLLAGNSRVDEETIERLEEILISADIGVDTSALIMQRVRDRARKSQPVDSATLRILLKEAIVTSLERTDSKVFSELKSTIGLPPHVVLVVGVNGVGKTTTIGKLAARYRSEGKSVMMAASDTFRAAANEQLQTWAERSGARLLKQEPGADPAAVAFDAWHSARALGTDVLIVDTAGRLHTKTHLMEELRKIKRVIQKGDISAPQEVLLVLDASTGQNGLQQAREFTASVGVTGIILTKIDGTAKGGIVFAIISELGIPVRYVGVGEGIDDLEPFDQDDFVEAILGGASPA